MKSILLLAFALLCTGLASALPPLHCSQWKCAPIMGSGIRPGRRLTYLYNVKTSTFLPGKKTPITVTIKTQATIEFYSCRRTLKLSSTSIASNDGKLAGDAKVFASMIKALEKNVLYFRSNDGAVDGLCSDDPVWVVNFKRGFLSVFQQPRSPIGQTKYNIEVLDIHGRCPISVSHRGWNTRITRNLASCRGRTFAFGGLQSSPYSVASPVQNAGLGSTQQCDLRFANSRRLLLKRASCSEKLVFEPPVLATILPQGSAHVVQKLELLKQETFKCGNPCRNKVSLSSFRSSGLEMQFEDAEEPVEVRQMASQLLCSLGGGPVRPENPDLFVRLVRFLRNADDKEWRLLVNSKPKTLCPKQPAAMVKLVLLEALAEAGDARGLKFITQQKALSLPEKDRLLSVLAFVRRPTANHLPHLRPIFEQFHRLPRASLAAAALVHRFCAGRNRCDRHPKVRPLLVPFERELKTPCDKMAVRRGTLFFRVLGNMPVPQRLHRHLTTCATQTKAPAALQVAAIQALRRTPCPVPRTALFGILRSHKYDSELRVAAYHALLQCRDRSLAKELRWALTLLRSAHVASYIRQHMENVRRSIDPDQTSLRHFLHDVGVSPRRIAGLSRHFQRTVYSLGTNAGLRADGSVLWSEQSPSPRSASARLTGLLFGRAVPFVELHGRMENVHEMMTRYRVPWAMRTTMKKPKASAQLGLRLFGHDVLVRHSEFTSYYRPPWQRLLKDLVPANFRKNCLLTDSSMAFASGAGLPFRLSFRAATSAALETVEWSRRDKGGFQAELGLKPEMAINARMAAAFELRTLRFGGEATGTAHTSTELRVKAEVSKKIFKLSFKAPEKQELLNLRWAISSLHQTQVIPVVQPAATPEIHWTSKPKLGYQFVVSVQNRPGTPQSRFGNEVSIYADRLDSHKFYTLQLWKEPKNGAIREVGIKMEMEGSKQNSAILGTIRVERSVLKLSLSGPSNRKFDAAIGCDRSKLPKEQCYLTAKSHRGNLIELRWAYFPRQPRTRTHTVLVKVGQTVLGNLLVRLTREKRGRRFYARLDDLMRTPVELHGRVTTSRPNELSIGSLRQVDLNMTSSFLLFDFNSKVELSDRKQDGLLQLKYDLPAQPKIKGSASVKFGWIRLSDKAFRDKFSFKSSFSQLPQLNTDLVLKSNVVKATNFRHDLLMKFGQRQIPVTASIRFLVDRKDRAAQSLVFQAAYQIPKLTKGEAALVCEWNRQHISFVKKLRLAFRGRQLVNYGLSIKRKADDQVDASLSFSSDITPYGVQAELRRPTIGGLTFRFDLKPDVKINVVAKPFFKAILASASNAGWMGKAAMIRSGLRNLNYSFSENSVHQLNFVGYVRRQRDSLAFGQSLTRRTKQIYSTVFSLDKRDLRWIGNFQFGVGPKAARRRLTVSFEHDCAKNLHNSNLELLVGADSASLRNDYSYEMSPTQQKIDGRSHVTSTFGRKRKFMLQTNINNLASQLSSDFQFSSYLGNKPSFVNVKVNVKDKNARTLAFSVALDSSFAVVKSAEVDYRHEVRPSAIEMEANVKHLKKSFQFAFVGKAKDRRNFSGRVGLGVNGLQNSVSVSSASAQPYGGNMKVRLQLPMRNIEFDVNYRGRIISSRFTQTRQGVEQRRAVLKLSMAKPSFELRLTENGRAPHLILLAREGSMWRARFEVDKPAVIYLPVTGKFQLHAGTGYQGHRFYLSHAVEGAAGVPLMKLDIREKRQRLQVDADCAGILAAGTPCQMQLDVQRMKLASSLDFGPVSLGANVNGDRAGLLKDASAFVQSSRGPVSIEAKAKGDLTSSEVTIKSDVVGLVFDAVYKAKLRARSSWTHEVQLSKADGPFLVAEVAWVTPKVQVSAQEVVWAIPLKLLPLQKLSVKSSSPLYFKSSLNWDQGTRSGDLQLTVLQDHVINLKVVKCQQITLDGTVLDRRFAVNYVRGTTRAAGYEGTLTVKADVPIEDGPKLVELAAIKVRYLTGPPGTYEISLKSPLVVGKLYLSQLRQELDFLLTRRQIKPGDGFDEELKSKIMPRFRDLRIILKNSFQEDKMRLDFDVTGDTGRITRCIRIADRRDCISKPGTKWRFNGATWCGVDSRYCSYRYKGEMSQQGYYKMSWNDEYLVEKRFIQRAQTRVNELAFGRKTISSERVRIEFSDAGQIEAVLHEQQMTNVFNYKQKTLLYSHKFVFNNSQIRFDMRGKAIETALAPEPGSDRVIYLRLGLPPSPSLRLRFGLAKRVAGSDIRFDLTGSGRPSDGALVLKTTRDKRPWMNCDLKFAFSKAKQKFVFKHTRKPKRGPKVTLDVSFVRTRQNAEQKIQLARGKREVLAALYERKKCDVTLSLTMLGRRHFHGTGRRVPGGYRVTAQSVSLKNPLVIQVARSPVRTAVEIEVAKNQPVLVIEHKRAQTGGCSFTIRQRSGVKILSTNIKPTKYGFEFNLKMGRILSATTELKRQPGARVNFTSTIRGLAKVDITYLRTWGRSTLELSTGSTRRMYVSVSRTEKSLQLGFLSFTFDRSNIRMSRGKQALAVIKYGNPAPNTITAALTWRPQLLRLAVDDAFAASESALGNVCSNVQSKAWRPIVQYWASKLPASPPFGDARTSFREFGRVMQAHQLFRAADVMTRVFFWRVARSVRRQARFASNFVCGVSPKMTLVRLRPNLYGLSDRLTTIRTLPDRLAFRFGRLVNGIMQLALRRAIITLEELELAQPQFRQYLPSPETLRSAQQEIDLRLINLKGITMLRGMQHLDKSVHAALKQAMEKLVRFGQSFDMELGVEAALEALEPVLRQFTPHQLRLRLLQLLRAALPKVRDSKIVVALLRRVGHNLNEFTRRTVQMAVPRIEQLNWRHGRARIILHVPRRLVFNPPDLMPRPPIDPRILRPGFHRVKTGSIYNSFVQTFDQRFLFIIGRVCPTLARFRHYKLGWEAKLISSGPVFKLEVRLGRRRYVIGGSEVRNHGKDPMAKAYFRTINGMQTMRAPNHGFELEMNSRRRYVRIRLLSPHFFRRMEGLFGNNDGLKNNDLATPKLPFNNSQRVFMAYVASKC